MATQAPDPRRRSTRPGSRPDDPFQDEAINTITSGEIGGVKTTAWILAATFIPTALLFAWCGRWFKSMEGSVPTFGAMMQQSAQMTADVQAAYPQDPQDPQYPQGPVVPGGGVVAGGSPVPSGPPPVPEFSDPIGPPPG
ncbi:MAG TPA: hypothetical protein VIT01_09040 [Acidimicrobiales bacterium]